MQLTRNRPNVEPTCPKCNVAIELGDECVLCQMRLTAEFKLIGLGHRAQAGKDTVAGFLEPLGFHRVAFADALRDLALLVDPLVDSLVPLSTNLYRHYKEAVDHLGYEQAKAELPEVRRFLQHLGVGARKIFGEDVWVSAAFRGVPRGKLVFSDVRFKNEAATVKELGGLLVRVHRPGFSDCPAYHVSETELEDHAWDVELHNDGDLTELHEVVRALFTPPGFSLPSDGPLVVHVRGSSDS